MQRSEKKLRLLIWFDERMFFRKFISSHIRQPATHRSFFTVT